MLLVGLFCATNYINIKAIHFLLFTLGQYIMSVSICVFFRFAVMKSLNQGGKHFLVYGIFKHVCYLLSHCIRLLL